MGKATTGRRRKVTSRAMVLEVLDEHMVSAEDVLVVLVDLLIDSHADAELRERGLGPERFEGVIPPREDALRAVQRAMYDGQFEFGKGFGRQPARGTMEDLKREQASFFGGTFERNLPPVQLTLRHLLGEAWCASTRFLDRIDPPEESPDDEDECEGSDQP